MFRIKKQWLWLLTLLLTGAFLGMMLIPQPSGQSPVIWLSSQVHMLFGGTMRLFQPAPDGPFSAEMSEAGRLWDQVNRPAYAGDKEQLLHRIIELYTADLRRNSPQVVTLYIDRGGAYFDLGQFDHAIADYTSALQHDPDAVDALKNRGLAYERQGNLRAALADFELFLDRIQGMPTERRAEERVTIAAKVVTLQAKLHAAAP